MSEYGLDAKLHMHKADALEIGHVKLNHKKSGYTVDHYGKDPNKDLKCGHQTIDHNRPGTKMLLDGIWVPAPDNPGLYGRIYGNEMYRHVPWTVSANNIYNSKVAKFPRSVKLISDKVLI